MTRRGTKRSWRSLAGAAGAGALTASVAGPARADAPMSYLRAAGQPGDQIVGLTWGLFILSLVVIAIIGVLVLAGVLMRRYRPPWRAGTDIPVMRGGSGALSFIYGGVILTVAVLAGFVVWTMITLVGISSPEAKTPFTIRITGHQWWWEAEYVSPEVSRRFITANEIHIPVGQPVRFEFRSQDVIHSFWVPALGGKTDVIPGHPNQAWLKADRPGIYRGQCSEYCGKQHAHMALRVFADPQDKFSQWWDHQLQDEPTPTDALAHTGQQQFLLQCSVCHTIRGTPADGKVGPDLTHLMSRTTIAANTLPNNPGNLSGWIANPQNIKPDALMPNLDLSGPELNAIRTYLLTLK